MTRPLVMFSLYRLQRPGVAGSLFFGEHGVSATLRAQVPPPYWAGESEGDESCRAATRLGGIGGGRLPSCRHLRYGLTYVTLFPQLVFASLGRKVRKAGRFSRRRRRLKYDEPSYMTSVTTRF